MIYRESAVALDSMLPTYHSTAPEVEGLLVCHGREAGELEGEELSLVRPVCQVKPYVSVCVGEGGSQTSMIGEEQMIM